MTFRFVALAASLFLLPFSVALADDLAKPNMGEVLKNLQRATTPLPADSARSKETMPVVFSDGERLHAVAGIALPDTKNAYAALTKWFTSLPSGARMSCTPYAQLNAKLPLSVCAVVDQNDKVIHPDVAAALLTAHLVLYDPTSAPDMPRHKIYVRLSAPAPITGQALPPLPMPAPSLPATVAAAPSAPKAVPPKPVMPTPIPSAQKPPIPTGLSVTREATAPEEMAPLPTAPVVAEEQAESQSPQQSPVTPQEAEVPPVSSDVPVVGAAVTPLPIVADTAVEAKEGGVIVPVLPIAPTPEPLVSPLHVIYGCLAFFALFCAFLGRVFYALRSEVLADLDAVRTQMDQKREGLMTLIISDLKATQSLLKGMLDKDFVFDKAKKSYHPKGQTAGSGAVDMVSLRRRLFAGPHLAGVGANLGHMAELGPDAVEALLEVHHLFEKWKSAVQGLSDDALKATNALPPDMRDGGACLEKALARIDTALLRLAQTDKSFSL